MSAVLRPAEGWITGVSGHAVDRFRERFGKRPTSQQWTEARQTIIDGKAPLIRRDPRGREVRVVNVGGEQAFVVYAPDTQTILTVLPNGVTKLRANWR